MTQPIEKAVVGKNGFVSIEPCETTSEFEINPKRQFEIKTTSQTPKTTYEQLCREVERAVAVLSSYAVSDTAKRKKIQHLRECLYESVRLPNWEYTTILRDLNAPAETAYQIFLGSTYHALVTAKTAEIVKGIRHFSITKGLEAQALFNAIGHARGAVSALREPVDDPALDEEFFRPLEEVSADQLDAVLADEEAGHIYSQATGSFTSEEIDRRKEWIEQKRSEGLDHQIKVDQSSQELADSFESSKSDPKQSRPVIDQDTAKSRLKSLQGRILTIVDASLADKTQRDAVKSLVSKEFRREMGWMDEFFLFPGQGCETAEEE